MFVNLTPHRLVVVDGPTIEPSGEIARVDASHVVIDHVDGVNIFAVHFGDVVGMPVAQDGVVFVVSALVAMRVRRPDVMSPGQLVRDSQGRVIGCEGLIRHTD